MKIPNNAILAVGGLAGAALTAWSSYWIGRRNELNQIIDLGREVEMETNLRELNMYDSKGKQVSLFLKTTEK